LFSPFSVGNIADREILRATQHQRANNLQLNGQTEMAFNSLKTNILSGRASSPLLMQPVYFLPNAVRIALTKRELEAW
jgi:hypothetical protein